MNKLSFTFENVPSLLNQLYVKIDSLEKCILEKNSNENEQFSKIWFNLIELCEYHPSKPKRPTVYAWVNRNLIPYHKRGKKLYFLKSEIDDWLKSGRIKTVAEIQSDADTFLTKKSKRS